MQLMWGIRGIDRHGTSRFRTDKTGKAKLDFDFDLRLASTQRHVVQTCGRMRKLKVTNGVRCWMEEFVKWKMGNGRAKYENYTSGTGLVYDILAFGMAETASGQRPYVKFLTGQKVLMRADLSDVVCVEIEMGMKAGENGGYERWQTELSRVNGRRRKGNGKAVMTGGKEWLWEVTQMTIEASMVVGIAGMLGLCTAMVWGMTLNIRVAVLAGGSLYGVAVSLLAGVEIMGWDIGVAESICAVLAVGYSFDGVAHVAIGYARGTAVGRVERMRETLGRIGISVVFGLVSTAGSAGILLAATIVLLVRLGALVLMTMALTAVWSLVLLPAMLLTMGPKEHA